MKAHPYPSVEKIVAELLTEYQIAKEKTTDERILKELSHRLEGLERCRNGIFPIGAFHIPLLQESDAPENIIRAVVNEINASQTAIKQCINVPFYISSTALRTHVAVYIDRAYFAQFRQWVEHYNQRFKLPLPQLVASRTQYTDHCNQTYQLVQEIRRFAEMRVEPAIAALPKNQQRTHTKKDVAIAFAYFKIAAWLHTFANLKHSYDIQAIGTGARAIFENYLDLCGSKSFRSCNAQSSTLRIPT